MEITADKRDFVIEINAKSFVLGLVWKTFYFETNSQKKRKLRVSKAAIHEPTGVVVESKGVCALGLTSSKLKGRPNSLAALLAKSYKNSVHLHQIEDKLFWVCWIKNGVPVAGSERFFSDGNDVREFIEKTLIPLTGTVEYFGDRKLVPAKLEPYFTDHDLETTIISLNEKDRSTRVKDLYFSNKLKILALGLILVVAASSVGLYLNSASTDLAASAQKLLERQTEKLRQRLDKSKNKFFSELHNYSNRANPGVWIKSVISVIGVFPDYYKGWTLINITCNGEDGKCDLYWKSTHHGTNANFIKRFTDAQITFHPNGDEALVSVPIPVNKDSSLTGEHFYEDLPTKSYFYAQYLSKIQYLEGSEVFRYEIGSDTEELSTELEPTIVDGKPVADKSIGVFIRQWGMKGIGLYNLTELSAELPANSFVIDSLDITYDNKVDSKKLANWKMEGRYAHKQ